MEVDGREFLNTPPMKTVRFGDYVANTLAKFKKGDKGDYELLKHQLTDPDIKDAQIINWLQEFRACVTQLNKDHEQLIYVVLRLPWLGRSQAVVDEYLSFLSNLVSAQTVYLRTCLKIVVSNFTPARVRIREGDVDISDSDDDDENLPRNFEHCHQALQIISRYVPSTSRFLMPILTDHFPFVQKSSRTLECYVHNLLRITVYIPTLRRDMLELLISKMLTLDVSASRVEIEDMEENAEQKSDEASQDECLFDMDEDTDSGLAPTPPDCTAMAHPVAERLDTLMGVLLAFIKDVCHQNAVLELERTKALYRDLLAVFDKLILPTHASCHVQYCVFYLCSFRLGLAEAFLDHLWKQLQSPSQPSVLRQAAAGYMGSFLARAKFLPVPTVRACLDLLVPWLHLYIDSQDASSRSFCDVTLHGPFYAACQAIFYTMVFRHRALVEGNMKKGLAYLQSLNLERIVMCQLNPLKVCLPAITNMFAAITRKYQLVFCYTIIERNNRSTLPVIRSSVGGNSVSANTNPLDSFFPFDPYLLKRSGKLIEPLYQVWEEPSDYMVDAPKKDIRKASVEEEDDFLQGETPQMDTVMGMTPGSFEAHLRSPSSVGSPPLAFLQRPF
ncbi:RNA polymerase I-specific transcription initiation factor RRN3 [Alosa pseudoharengus]|uniref:RNA polymerase I-specific transcription initiation factor RRN3 n=1 Tax=Alosa pseudoharengus TaxID=34774 RepID=UPI003F888772